MYVFDGEWDGYHWCFFFWLKLMGILQVGTLPETNIAPTFLLGRPIFRGELLVSGWLNFPTNSGS